MSLRRSGTPVLDDDALCRDESKELFHLLNELHRQRERYDIDDTEYGLLCRSPARHYGSSKRLRSNEKKNDNSNVSNGDDKDDDKSEESELHKPIVIPKCCCPAMSLLCFQ